MDMLEAARIKDSLAPSYDSEAIKWEKARAKDAAENVGGG